MVALKKAIRFYADNTTSANAAIAEFTTFKSAVGPELPYDDATFKCMCPKQWWQLHGATYPHLQPVALRAFSVGTSSSTSERNFSTFGHIWTDRANSLDFRTVHKLVYIYYNLRSLSKLRDGTGRKAAVEHGWMQREVESDEEE